MAAPGNVVHREPWNKGKIVGQKALFQLKDIWALRVRFQMEGRVRKLALINPAPYEKRVRGPRVKTCLTYSSLIPLRELSLLKTRGGSEIPRHRSR